LSSNKTTLKLLPKNQYKGVNHEDPLRFYYWPVFGRMYRKRVELCLDECKGGDKILEIGFGSGMSFLNLTEKYQEIHGLDLTADIKEVQSVFDGLAIQTHLQNGNVLSMPYETNSFDTVLLISILEHLKPMELELAFKEIYRVLKPGGQVVYGVPVERPFMVSMFRILGTDIRTHHFSTDKEIYQAALKVFTQQKIQKMVGPMGLFGQVYEIGHFNK
jgi:ubiquinone/menaquinone biosynthesis C-methylase UbiE